jgi:3-hydroxyisobutyrate dehydrogenase
MATGIMGGGRPMSRDIIHVGPTGSGAHMKLVNIIFCGMQVASLAEAMAWIKKSGLDTEYALAALTGSPLVKTLSARMTARDYATNFVLRLMAKDLYFAEKEAAESAVTPRTAAAIAAGFGEHDFSAVVEHLRAVADAKLAKNRAS